MSSDLDVMMEVAIYLARLGHDQRALQLFREVAFANPFRPEPYALGLASAKRLDDVDGIRWATLGILSQAWPEAHQVGLRIGRCDWPRPPSSSCVMRAR